MNNRKVLVTSQRLSPTMKNGLARQIQLGLKKSGLRYSGVTDEDEYILIDTPDELEVAETVAQYPGINYAAVVESTSSAFDDLVNLVFRVGSKAIYPDETFRVLVSQSVKLDYTPRDVEVASTSKLIGEVARIGARPDDSHPSKMIYVTIGRKAAYVFLYRYDGPGGLPAGSRGNAICLLTGDMWSGVATWLAIRGGIVPHFLVYSVQPYTHYSHIQGIFLTALKLKQRIPVEDLELSFMRGNFLGSETCPNKMRPVILKRMLVRTACLYAEKLNCNTVIAGENLSKDPLWLLKNLVDTAASLRKYLVFPTLGLTGNEVNAYAESVGIVGKSGSYIPDAKQGLGEVPLQKIKDLETRFGIDQMIDGAISKVYRKQINTKNIDLHALLNDIS